MAELRRLCVYAGDDWVDVVRLYEMPCDGMLRYVVRHNEVDGLWVFDSVEEALGFIAREFVDVDVPLRVGGCP
ncbi:MAG: hypothetical protein RXO32_11895 [Thermoproteus sp.]